MPTNLPKWVQEGLKNGSIIRIEDSGGLLFAVMIDGSMVPIEEEDES